MIKRYLGSLFVASVAIFTVMRLIPGDPARVALGVTATDEAVAELSHQLGTDRPILVQYLSWMKGMLTGDFGMSLASRTDITPLIIDRIQVSLILCATSIVLSIVIAAPAGILAARTRGWTVGVITQIGIAVPSFLAAILMVSFFSVHLGWLPSSGWVPPGQDFGAFVSRLILPVAALALVQASILTRYVRSAVIEAGAADHVRTARAAGATRTQALVRHVLPSAAVPVLTVTGLQLTSLIVGAVVIEQVFLIPGLGTMLLDGVAARDIPVVQTIVMLLVVFTLTVNALVDFIHSLIDPRISTAVHA